MVLHCSKFDSFAKRKKNMKIIHFMNRPEVGGILIHLINEFKMNLDGIEAEILFQENRDDHVKGIEMLEAENIPYSIIPDLGATSGPIYFYRLYQWMLRHLRSEKPDILVTHSPLPGYAGRLAAFRARVPVTVHILHGHYFHSYFSRPVTEVLRRLEKYLARRTTRVLTISDEMKNALVQDYGIAKADGIEVMPIHIDLSSYTPLDAEESQMLRRAQGFEPEDIVFISVGRLAPIKNQKLFIDLIAMLRSEGINAKGILVGKGESAEDLKQYARDISEITVNENEIDGQADFSFAGERRDIAELLNGSDIFVLTSLNEGTPLTILEAQAAGLPILSTDVGGVSGIVDVNTTARLSDVDDIEKMYENALELIELDRSQALERSQAIKDRYDLKRKRQSMQDFYDQFRVRPSQPA